MRQTRIRVLTIDERATFEGFEMTLILHITTRKDWEHARQVGIYKPESLEKQGFIHCSYPSQLVKVADANYPGRKDLVLLCIESNRVRADIHEEGTGDESYPHIFGPLNLDSVARALEFTPDKAGKFKLPPSMVATQGREKPSSITFETSFS